MKFVWPLFWLLLSGSALAYIPPAYFLVRNLCAKHSGVKGIRVRSTVSVVQGGKLASARFKQVLLYDFQARQLRSTALDDQGNELYVTERRLGEPAQGGALADSVLFETGVEPLVRVLRAGGIPVRTAPELDATKTVEDRLAVEDTRLARLGDQVAWVLSASSSEVKAAPGSAPVPVRDVGDNSNEGVPKKPELWIEKDGFLPLRLISRANDQDYDLHFESYRAFKDFHYPRVITLFKLSGGSSGDTSAVSPILKEDLGELIVNPDLSALKVPVNPGYTESGNSADRPVRDLIQAYYRSVR